MSKLYKCPRCNGTGNFSLETEDGNGFSETCKACGKTGKLTPEQWEEWCQTRYGEGSRWELTAADEVA